MSQLCAANLHVIRTLIAKKMKLKRRFCTTHIQLVRFCKYIVGSLRFSSCALPFRLTGPSKKKVKGKCRSASDVMTILDKACTMGAQQHSHTTLITTWCSGEAHKEDDV